MATKLTMKCRLRADSQAGNAGTGCFRPQRNLPKGRQSLEPSRGRMSMSLTSGNKGNKVTRFQSKNTLPSEGTKECSEAFLLPLKWRIPAYSC